MLTVTHVSSVLDVSMLGECDDDGNAGVGERVQLVSMAGLPQKNWCAIAGAGGIDTICTATSCTHLINISNPPTSLHCCNCN